MKNAVELKPQRTDNARTPVPARLSKQESLRLAAVFKRAVVVAATLAFGVFAGLVAGHNGNTVASQPPTVAPSGPTAAPTQATSQSGNSAGDLFNAQGQNGYGFGSNGGQLPVSGSSAS